MTTEAALVILESISSDQWGLVTREQAVREGVSAFELSCLLDEKVLYSVRPGVYSLPSAPLGRFEDLQASWLSLDAGRFLAERWEDGPTFVVAHESAAAVHGIGNLIPHANTFVTSGSGSSTGPGFEVLIAQDVGADDVVSIDGLPVTSIGRTIADLAVEGMERQYLSIMVVDALEKEGVRVRDIASRLDACASAYGANSGRQLVHQLMREGSSLEERADILERAEAFGFTRK
ncbi:MAG: hypothetical protein SPK00_04260 [Corynebacterium glucuronolyticum]|nr:hypothetical protein [Mycobacteriaceae bacterium]MDY5833950.1 hypothetical protein [Corynebacterium glucuronolyticum]